MADETSVEKPSPIIPMLRSDLLSILIVGAITGLVIWALGMMLNRYIFQGYLCQSEISAECASADNYAVVVASILAIFAALGGLIRLRVYRPLLVIIASLVSLWGVVQESWNYGWYTGILVVVVLYALAFGAFTWIARIREFWITLILVTVLVVIVRLALVA